jgi:probable blue pigment (indigoidine) exporter
VAAAAGGVQPLLVTAFSWLVVRRSPRRHEVLTGVIAAVGVGLVVVRPGAGLDVVGVAFALGANVSFAMGVVLTKRFAAPPNRIAATGWQLSMAGVLLLPIALVAEGPPPHLTGEHLLGFAYLSVVATGVAYLLWFDGIRKLPAPAPPLLGLAAPITGAFMGWLVLDQALSPVQLLGFAVTLGAIARGATLPEAAGPEAGRPVPSGSWPERAASPTSATRTAGAAGSATSPSIPTCP